MTVTMTVRSSNDAAPPISVTPWRDQDEAERHLRMMAQVFDWEMTPSGGEIDWEINMPDGQMWSVQFE